MYNHTPQTTHYAFMTIFTSIPSSHENEPLAVYSTILQLNFVEKHKRMVLKLKIRKILMKIFDKMASHFKQNLKFKKQF